MEFKKLVERRYVVAKGNDPLHVTIYQQINDFTCGPAALLTAMSHFGEVPAHINAQTLADMMATNRDVGTANDRMIAAAKKLGYYADSATDSKLSVVEDQLSHERPVLVVYNDKVNGYHFVVVTHADKDHLVIADPWARELQRLPKKEFEDRWYDSEGTKGWWMSLTKPTFKVSVSAKYEVRSGPKDDYAVQTKLRAHARHLKDYLNEHHDEIVMAGVSMEQEPKPNTKDDMRKPWFWSTDGALLVNGHKIFREYPYMDFWIMFRDRAKGHHGHTPSSKMLGGSALIVFSVLKGPYDIDAITSRLDDSLFAHEVTHHFDSKRYPATKDTGRKYDSGNLKSYFNDPAEYNAFYQEGLTTLHFLLETDKVPKEKKKDLLGLDFNHFKERVFKQNFEPAFLANLEPKYLQKLSKRLYGFWKFHHEKLAGK